MKWNCYSGLVDMGFNENLNDLDADIVFIKTLTMLFFKIMRLLLYIKRPGWIAG
jgi:hypothetical protein